MFQGYLALVSEQEGERSARAVLRIVLALKTAVKWPRRWGMARAGAGKVSLSNRSSPCRRLLVITPTTTGLETLCKH